MYFVMSSFLYFFIHLVSSFVISLCILCIYLFRPFVISFFSYGVFIPFGLSVVCVYFVRSLFIYSVRPLRSSLFV